MAKDTIGSMVAVVSATATQFDADLRKAAGSVDRFKQHVSGVGQSFLSGLGLGSGIAAVSTAIDGLKSAFTAVKNTVIETINAVDDLSDTARTFGITADELGSLRFAAEQAGSSVSTFERAFKRMLISIGQARGLARGTGLRKTFEDLGLDVDKLANTNRIDAFKAIADAIHGLGNRAAESEANAKIFGKGTADLLPLLDQGTEGIGKLSDEFLRLHGSIDTLEFDKAKDALVRYTTLWDGLKVKLTQQVIPALEKTAQTVVNNMGALKIAASFLPGGGIGVALGESAGKFAFSPNAPIGEKSPGQPIDPIAEAEKKVKSSALSIARLFDALNPVVKAHNFTTGGTGAVQQGTTAGFSAAQAAARQSVDLQRQLLSTAGRHLTQSQKQTEILRQLTQLIRLPLAVGF